ncbi:DUF1552 domain-containing protein [Marinagarivorans cellulosilyticus]|uniref:DUF1552 domain-containing protein n=1 Tax=Marinagarivorans cellulosilyticus TaxID=2721545 RepID=A0AAN1WIP3_9GAMM|nr:DUF1552 domain-containing protein [Marinagarivorans cellulosilyticus]BCD98294.1 hypothetical protein MARGE09_P2495 [Marinagarivorans cellulosilyticus]
MKTPFRNTRRRFVKNAIVAGTLSPVAMRIAQPALAAVGQDTPKVVFVYMPDGVYCPKNADGTTSHGEAAWHPTGAISSTGDGYSIVNNPVMNDMTKAFTPIQEHMTFLQGLDMKLGGGSHQGGTRKVLTGNGDNSLDIILGQQDNIGGQTPVRNVNLGAMANFQAGTTDHSHYYNGVSVKPEDDPVAAFNRAYGLSSAPGATPGGYDPRRDIVSQAHKELEALMKNDLGVDERLKLSANIDALNDLQKKLDGVANAGGDSGDTGLCSTTNFNPNKFDPMPGVHPPQIHLEDNFTTVAGLQVDLMTRLLGCGMTRVGGLQMSHTTSNFRSHHSISHNFSQAWINSLDYFYSFLIEMVQRFKATPDGSSNLLDNTLIYVFSCLSDGKLHDHRDMPFMLIGGHNFGIQGNRQIRYDLNAEGDGRGVDHTKLLVSIAKYMGHDIESFGTNGVTGELPGLYS